MLKLWAKYGWKSDFQNGYPKVYFKFFFELFEIAILFYLLKSIKICF